ncbi:hypothetical protein EON65_19320 [archaeon]|nr:MAG: hypothetical protein EON65_19320 [archaeon]
MYVAYVVLFPVATYTTSLETAQTLCCFVPPLALQIGCGAFLKSYTGISVGKICSIMVRLFDMRIFISCRASGCLD